jgi:RHS repeat-associated protein
LVKSAVEKSDHEVKKRLSSYSFAFNGMEQDNEVKGEGNSYTTEFRQYDPRLGRWASVDPARSEFPWQSPYVAMDNKPIIRNDVNGDCPTCGAAVVGAAVGFAMEMVMQIGEHMINGDGFSVALDKVNYVDVGKEAGIGFFAGITGFGAAKYVKNATKVLKSPAARSVLIATAEMAVDYAVSTALEMGYDASNVEGMVYGALGFNKLTNKEIGDIGEAATKKLLGKKYNGKGYSIMEQVKGTYSDGTKTVFDFAVVDKNGSIIEIAESKANKGDFTKQQRRFFGKKGESVKIDLNINGKKMSSSVSAAKTVAKTYRHTVNRYTASTVYQGAKSALRSVIKKVL